jgi:hypothetical protein
MSVGRRTSGLHYENIRTTNIFSDREIELAIGEPVGNRLAKIAGQMPADLVCKFRVCIAREYLYVAGYAHQAVKFQIRDSNLLRNFKSAISNSDKQFETSDLTFQKKNGRLIRSSSRSDN